MPAALETLGYGSAQIEEVIAHAVGHASLGNCPGINTTALIGPGVGPRELEKIEAALPTAFDIRFVFNQWTLGVEFCAGTLGIPEDKLAKIFQPFFTTKKRGKGTGLGLAFVRRIVEAHHGRITVASTVGQGTTFTVVLPGNA